MLTSWARDSIGTFSTKGGVSKIGFVLEINPLAPYHIPPVERVEQMEQPELIKRLYYHGNCTVPHTIANPGHVNAETTREIHAVLLVPASKLR